MINRIRNAVSNECGASTLEILIWISIIIVICSMLMIFWNVSKNYLASASDRAGDKPVISNFESQNGIVLVH